MVSAPETISAAARSSLRFSEEELEEVKNSSDISFASEIKIYAIIEEEDGCKNTNYCE